LSLRGVRNERQSNPLSIRRLLRSYLPRNDRKSAIWRLSVQPLDSRPVKTDIIFGFLEKYFSKFIGYCIVCKRIGFHYCQFSANAINLSGFIVGEGFIPSRKMANPTGRG
jgi:hypothetical protein